MELTLSKETLRFLGDELEDMLCHCDLTETQCDELGALLDALDMGQSFRLDPQA